MPQSTPGERTPLLNSTLQDCCSSTKGCCSAPKSHTTPSSCFNDSESACCQQQSQVNNADYCQLAEQPWQYKAVALICALLLAVGSHFAAHTLGAMKNTIKLEFGISNSQYGVIQSSVSIVNTVLPVLGGLYLDAFGTVSGSILTTVLITFGNILVALSMHNTSLTTMIVGRVMYGIGSGTVVIVQETILSQWFKGRSLAGVMALMLTVSRLASFLAQAVVVPIANWTGWFGYGFWFSALLCIISFVFNLVYVALLRKVSPRGTGCHKQLESIRRKKSFSWSKLLYLPHSYWLVVAMEFLLGGSWGCFLHINSEFVKFRFGYSNAHAAATASLAQVLPVFLMPILGICLDRYGKRTWMMIGSGASMLTSLLLLEFTPLNPVVGMLMFSLSLALGPVGLVSSVPIILPLSMVGTGMGLIKSGTNIGASLFDIFSGLLQDADPNKGYTGVIMFFIVIAALATLAGIVLCILDHTIYDHLLDRSARRALQSEHENKQSTNNNSGEMKKIWANWIYGSIFFGLACTSWVLFTRFVLL
ncbi:major facilitator superfamily transporter [Lichtheimia corymbifera JMRC:FSU:9682]|uniref:Lysosomal dipeptide transporter MFSD1 n=1 Tax=Lichtheimia corymbifera JMRC:FSU:9682 TaxID=1263082 RepID=A0A068RYI8_9FUNG|nr:major facilitator superfamily transporter [Lichtheimia corymbifera JMRC:FSU:9682]